MPKEYKGIEQLFASEFLDGKNFPQWGDLASAIAGGLVHAVFTGLISFPLSVGAAIDAAVSPVTNAFREGATDVASAITAASSAAWDPFQLSFASLPVNVVFVIAALGLIAVGWKYV